jgi:hypothetical protein
MADNNSNVENDLTQEQAIAGYKFFMALQEIKEKDRLNELFSELKVGNNYAAEGAEKAIERFSQDFDPKNASKNLEIVKNKFPDIYEAITKEIEEKNISRALSNNGLKAEDFDEESLLVMKTAKAFDDRFPDRNTSLSKRLGLIKDSLLEAKNSTNGKIVFNTLMLGVALGTGGVGAIAGIKLAMAVGEKLMTNKKVADLAASVTGKAVDYMKNELHIPTDEIRDGINKVKSKVSGNKTLKWVALGVTALLVGGIGLDHLMNHGAMTAAAQDFASNQGHDVMEKFGFNSGADHVVGGAVPSTDGLTAPVDGGTIPAPVDGAVPSPLDGVNPDSVDVVSPASVEGVTPAVSPDGVTSAVGPDGVTPAPSAVADVAGAAQEAPVHTVVKGDTLWDITHKLLGEHASNHDIAKGVKALIDANPQIHNPDLIFPGDSVNIPSGLVHDVPSVGVTDLKAAVGGSVVESHQGIDVATLKSVVDSGPLNALGTPVVSFPAGEGFHAFTDAATKISSSGVDGVHATGFETTEIQPNTGAASRMAEIAKGVEVAKNTSKSFQLDM